MGMNLLRGISIDQVGVKAIGSAALMASIGLIPNMVQAATVVTWANNTSDADANFEAGTNWIGGAKPIDSTNSVSGAIAVLPATVTEQPILSISRSLNGLQFNAAGWSLSGSGLTLSLGNGGINANANTSGTDTVSSNVAITADQTWSVGTGGTLLVSGNVSGSSGQMNIGSVGNTGTVQLTGTGTYSIVTNVNYGTLQLAGTNTTPQATNINIATNGTLQLAGSGGNQIDDGKSVTINGGTFDLNALNETINQLSGSSGIITNTATGTSTLSLKNGSTFGGTIQDGGTGKFVAINSTSGQALTLSGNNSYSGGTSASGTLIIGSNTALGTGAVTAVGGVNIKSDGTTARILTNTLNFFSNPSPTFGSLTSASNGNLTFGALGGGSASVNVYNTTTITGNFSADNGTFSKNQVGNFIFAGNYNDTGTTQDNINAGSVAVAGTYVSSAKFNLAGGQLGRNGQLIGALNAAGSVLFASGKTGGLFAYGNSATFGNSANNLQVNFGNASAAITWNGTGSSFLSSGQTLLLGNAISNGNVDLQNSINLNNAAQTVSVALGSTNTAGAADAKLSGKLTAGGLTKTGTGVLAVSNATNDYALGTIISTGTLDVTSTGKLGTGGVSVATGAILELDNNVTISDAALLSIAARNGLGTDLINLNFAGNETVGSLSLNGVTMGGGLYNASTYSSYFTGSGSIYVVPEPAMGILFLSSMTFGMRRRERKI